MGFRELLRDTPVTNGLYNFLRDKKHAYRYNKVIQTKYTFTDRSHGYAKCCVILAGYKAFVWDTVFERIRRFVPQDVDVCVVSSGVQSAELAAICEKNGWSYLSTVRNHVSVAQNLAIHLMNKAEWIYKLDEDVFVTEGYFETLMNTYETVTREGEYDVGFVAPLLPINGYAHLRVLHRFDLVKTYTERFERPIYAGYATRQIECNPQVAEFFWGEGGEVPHIDDMARQLQADPFTYSACPVRFSIGAILFTRDTWKAIGYFPVGDGNGLGLDETVLCAYCVTNSQAMIVSENTLVGHLSFGKQNAAMKAYYEQRTERFAIRE